MKSQLLVPHHPQERVANTLLLPNPKRTLKQEKKMTDFFSRAAPPGSFQLTDLLISALVLNSPPNQGESPERSSTGRE